MKQYVQSLVAPIAKAVAGAATILVLFVLAWLAKNLGINIDANPESLTQWFQATIGAILTGLVVWWQKNTPEQ